MRVPNIENNYINMKHLVIICMILIGSPLLGQYTGDWILTHRYESQYGTDRFNPNYKISDAISIWSFNEQEVTVLSVKAGDVFTQTQNYKLSNDTFILSLNNNYNIEFKIFAFADSLILAEGEKGTSFVLSKLMTVKQKRDKEEILSILLHNSLTVDRGLYYNVVNGDTTYSTENFIQEFIFKNDNILDIVNYNNNEFVSQSAMDYYSNLFDKWFVISSNYNNYLILGPYFYLIKKIQRKSILVNGFEYGVFNDLKFILTD